MKYLLASMMIAAMFFISCGNAEEQEQKEIQGRADSIAKDTVGQQKKENAADAFLNDTTISADSVARNQR